jgi:hypothetical protein
MTVGIDQAQALQPQSIESLAEIYEGMEARVYRLDDSHAVVRLLYGRTSGVVVIWPWSWAESVPTSAAYNGLVCPENTERLRAWLSEKPGAVAEMDFASLLLWACRRSLPPHRRITEEGYQEDAQRVGPRAFNRFLIREALQMWLQTGARPGDTVRIEAIHAETAALRLSCGGARVLVAALIDEIETGDDPLLTDWPSDAFGAVETARSARIVNQAN